MSTRSVIARPAGDGFEGRYHHYDGYPQGLGAELWHLYHGEFGGDVDRMVHVLIDDEPVWWSSIIGADWTQPKCWPDHNLTACAACGLPCWRHYGQYYGESTYNTEGLPRLRAEVLQFDHTFTATETPTGPLSYSARGEVSEDYMIRSDGDDGGTEYAYVLTYHALYVFERRWDDGSHMTGMFGAGAAAGKGYWFPLAEARWDDDEPAWSHLRDMAEAR